MPDAVALVGRENLLNTTIATAKRTFSPVLLNQEWPKVTRLLLLLGMISFGSMMNCFYIGSFYGEEQLRQKRSIFQALLGLADLIISGPVMFISLLAVLSNMPMITTGCYLQLFLTETSTYMYTLLFMMAAGESYFRNRCSQTCHGIYLKCMVIPGISLAVVASVSLAYVGVYMQYDYDYCQRSYVGNYYFRFYTSIFLQAIPCLITTVALFVSAFNIKIPGFERSRFRSQQYDDETNLACLNIVAYIVYVVPWIPYLIIVNAFPNMSDSKYYQLAWVGVSRCIITSPIYGVLNRYFRRAFIGFINYCFCKSTGSNCPTAESSSIGEVSVNVLQRALSSSPRSSSSYTREVTEL